MQGGMTVHIVGSFDPGTYLFSLKSSKMGPMHPSFQEEKQQFRPFLKWRIKFQYALRIVTTSSSYTHVRVIVQMVWFSITCDNRSFFVVQKIRPKPRHMGDKSAQPPNPAMTLLRLEVNEVYKVVKHFGHPKNRENFCGDCV